jgi:spermidine synthase
LLAQCRGFRRASDSATADVPNLQESQPDDAMAPADRRTRLLLPLLFAASGCAALIYQVVWFQLLSLTIGASAISLGVLLATFLGGMCLGSLLLGRFLASRRHPLRVYALLELGIAALGVGVLYALPAIGVAYAAWAGPGLAGLMLRLLVAAVCLLPSTVLMGGTLPVIARAAGGTRRGVAWLGFLYGANVAGAVFGSLIAGFYLLRIHDVQVATFVAVALNLAAGAASLPLAATTSEPPSRTVRATSSGPRWPVYVATALSGMTALSAEVLWTRHLSLLLGSTVYAFALILAVFLLGLGLGSVVGAVVGARADARTALCYAQLLLCAAMAWAAYAIAGSLPYWPLDVTLPSTSAVALQLDLVRAAWAILPAALLWGASFPLALAAAAPGEEPRRVTADLYAANTFGAIVGTLATSFVFVVWLGSVDTQRLMILVAACSGLLLLLYPVAPMPPRGSRRVAVGAAVALGALALALAVPALPPALVAYGRFLPTRGTDANVVYVGEGLTASIAVTREPSGILTYHNAGKTQASTYPQDLKLQRMLGHLTTLVADEPSSVLVIGLGAGITGGAVAIDPAVERVVVAEIEALVPRVADDYFATQNFGVVGSPKVEIRIDDGRHYLATTAEKFDAITSDPLDPWVKGAAALYTREFWELCKARLSDGGVVTVFLQLYESTEESVRSEIATFLSVFPNGVVFANTVEGQGYDAVLLGRAGDAPIDVDRLSRRLDSGAYEPVARSLREVGFDSAIDLLGTYAGQATDLADWLGDAAINTDRNLRLQYLAGEGLNVYRAQEIFTKLVGEGPRFPEGLFTGSPARLEELRQRLRAKRGRY